MARASSSAQNVHSRSTSLLQDYIDESIPARGLMECLCRTKGRKLSKRQFIRDVVQKLAETETMLDELHSELRYLREHRHEQEDTISKLKKDINTLDTKKIQAETEVVLVKETLHLSHEENLQLKESETKNNKKLDEMHKQLMQNHENLEFMTKSFKKSVEHVENLEKKLKKFEAKINRQQGVKDYLAKNSAEKEKAIKMMKELYRKDRAAFVKVNEFNLEKFDQLQKKYEHVLRHLWERCRRSYSSSVHYSTLNKLSNPEEISLRMLQSRQEKHSTDGISITNEPNKTILNTTLTMIENELYRYRIMNNLLEDRIIEYEPEYSRSSEPDRVASLSSSVSDQAVHDDTSEMKILSDSSLEQPTTLDSSSDIYRRVSNISEADD